MSAIAIRNLVDADLPAVIDLKWDMTLLHQELPGTGTTLDGDLDLTREAAAMAIERDLGRVAERGGAILVAEDHGTVVGYASWYPDTGSVTIRAERRRFAYLSGLAVAESHRGRGLGARLVAEVEQQARRLGLARLSLGVATANTDASRLYDRLGFVPLSTHMTKPLD